MRVDASMFPPKPHLPDPRFLDITGQSYGRLTPLWYAGDKRWICKCTCGQHTLVLLNKLRTGRTKSCGCLNSEMSRNRQLKHGLSNTSIYRRWRAMLNRCYLKSTKAYKDYGGRGIRVCKRWHKFENFLKDFGLPPSAKHSIERINNDGNYTPANCRWATCEEQQSNTRRNRRITFMGKTKTLAQWTRDSGRSNSFLENRLRRGMSEHDALTVKARQPPKKKPSCEKVTPSSPNDRERSSSMPQPIEGSPL